MRREATYLPMEPSMIFSLFLIAWQIAPKHAAPIGDAILQDSSLMQKRHMIPLSLAHTPEQKIALFLFWEPFEHTGIPAGNQAIHKVAGDDDKSDDDKHHRHFK
jgi:hypothetical protein